MDLLTYLRADLVPLMKRREKVALRAVRDAISAIENAETSYLATPAKVGSASEFVAGALTFGTAERVVRPLSDAEMWGLARAEVDRRLEDAVQLREHGDVDRALMLKAEALALSDRLDAWRPEGPDAPAYVPGRGAAAAASTATRSSGLSRLSSSTTSAVTDETRERAGR